MKKIIIIILAIGFSWSLKAQQLNSFSQTIENKYLINPAVVGSDESMPVFLGYKRIWTGIDAAPSTQLMSFHMKISDELGGIGAKIYNYSTGPLSKAGMNVSYAYHLELNKDMKLAFGLSAALYQVNLNKSELKVDNANDELIMYGSEKLIVPDANFGMYLYAKDYYFGISSFQLFGRKVNLMNDKMNFNQERHYYVNGGYIYEATSDIKLEPSILMKFIEAGVNNWDFYLKTTYKDMVWFGLGYSSDFKFEANDLILSIGVQQDKIKFGYAFDYTLSEIGNISNGTHEIIFMYMFGDAKPSYKW
jgi:type IX secretion system PorP/SprF family membrane protein